MKKIITLCLLLSVILTGCTTAILSPEGASVTVVQSISATDLVYYDNVGSLTCLYMMDEPNCINDLKNQAGALGATIIRITSKQTGQICGLDKKNMTCINMTADAFKRKPDQK